MIIQIEIDQFIKEIETKSESLTGDQKEKALDKLRLLHRIKSELRDVNDECSRWAMKFSDSELTVGKIILENLKMKKYISTLEKELENIKKHISRDV